MPIASNLPASDGTLWRRLRRLIAGRSEFSTQPTAQSDLWDPWLDGRGPLGEDDLEPDHPAENAAGESRVDINESPPLVKPRVLSPETGESLPLTHVIGPILTGREPGVIRLVGGLGSGKTTALAYLAGVLPPYLRVCFLDNPHPSEVVEALSHGWLVCTSSNASASLLQHVPTNLRLAPWGEDEWIEYLLARDRRTCVSVMDRLAGAKAEAAQLDGNPELWCVVLDRMMGDRSIQGPITALKSELATLMSAPAIRPMIEADCFVAVCKLPRANLSRHDLDEALFRLIRHRPVQLLLAANWLARSIKHRAESEALAVTLPQDLVLETASQIAQDASAVHRLRSLIKGPNRRIHPMVASLLHALQFGWIPSAAPPRLAGAFLAEASWPAIDLTRADLRGVDLAGANLTGSRFDLADLEDANLKGANLSASSMERATLKRSDLSHACCTEVRAERACFDAARLAAANFSRANLDRTTLVDADLTGAAFAGASMARADLSSAKIDGADFSGANLTRAILQELRLTGAQFAGACFLGADLTRCNLEGVLLPQANFAASNLREALLTGSRMPGADFLGACLDRAGLTEIDWEGADLRRADLRGVSFHLGSSRSGMVGSPIAGEGTRTGFYTDDFDERSVRSPEEIRKANLRGADLRGARIEGVDFYLVDLRGARLDPDQIHQIRLSGAILEARV
jgi:uncharacterized protein YjbI with pentapeptide repeats